MPSPTPSVSITEADSRRDAMHSTVDDWLDALATELKDNDGHDRLQRWLDVQAAFPEYTARNAILLALQAPTAEQVATTREWEVEFERSVDPEATPIWLWTPEYAPQCPACEQRVIEHEHSECAYDALETVDWPRMLVRHTPLAVFSDIQTEGREVPESVPSTVRSATTRFTRVLAAAPRLGIDLRVVGRADWPHGAASARFAGPTSDGRPRVEVQARERGPTDSVGVLQAYARARLHALADPSVAIGRGGEALAVTVIVCEAVDIGFDAPTLSLGAWRGDDVHALKRRLGRISCVARELKDAYRRPEELTPP